MKCTVRIYVLNDHFSQEYADIHNNGEDSELNRKYRWQDELSITSEVKSIEMIENATYPLQGVMPDGGAFSIDVAKMTLFCISSQDADDVYVGCSQSIIDSYEIVEGDEFELKIFIKDDEPLANPVPGIYIASKEFPKELID